MTKETYIYDKRDLHIWQKRPTYMTKETYIYDKRDLHIWQKRLPYMAKEPYICGTHMQETPRITTADKSRHAYESYHAETQIWRTSRTYMTKSELHTWQKRPSSITLEALWHKRPTYMASETNKSGERDLHIWQKRPTYMTKEIEWTLAALQQPQMTKKYLHTWQMRPTHMTKETHVYDNPKTNIYDYQHINSKNTYIYMSILHDADESSQRSGKKTYTSDKREQYVIK